MANTIIMKKITILFAFLICFLGYSQKAQIDLPITWNDTANVDYSVADFGGNSSAVVVDPTNASNMVLMSTKTSGAQPWAGTTLSTTNGLATAIPFAAGSTTMSVAVWSPDAGTVIRLKAEDKTDGTKSVETEATTGAAATWDTLVFDFSNQAAGTAAIDFTYTYDLVSIFYDFLGAPATPAKSYYCDNVIFGSPTIGIEENWVEDFKIFPNPNNGNFNITGSLKVTSEVSILITDMQGRVILKDSENGTILNKSINLNSVANGIYLVKISSESGSKTEKIVITN